MKIDEPEGRHRILFIPEVHKKYYKFNPFIRQRESERILTFGMNVTDGM